MGETYIFFTHNFLPKKNVSIPCIPHSIVSNLPNLFIMCSIAVGKINTEWRDKFMSAINDYLNMSQALAVLNEMLKSEFSKEDKLATAYDFDEILGLEFKNNTKEIKADKIPDEVQKLVDERSQVRKDKNWAKSDELRDKIKELGYEVKDMAEGIEIRKI